MGHYLFPQTPAQAQVCGPSGPHHSRNLAPPSSSSPLKDSHGVWGSDSQKRKERSFGPSPDR